MGLSEQMLKMSGLGGLHLGPIRWQAKSNGKSVAPVETPLPLQQVCPRCKTPPHPAYHSGSQNISGIMLFVFCG